MVLVVQERVPLSEEGDVNVLLSPFVAEELDNLRRVSTVLWSVADPRFAEWLKPDTVKVDPTKPEIRTALDLAKANGADFVLWVRATKHPEGIRPSAVLYERGRKVWSFEPKNERPRLPTGIKATKEDRDKWQREAEALLATSGMLLVVVDGNPDWELTSTSVARTWANQLGQTVLQRFPAAPEPPPAHLAGGARLGQPQAVAELVRAADDAAAQGNTLQELAALRRAVDAGPFDSSLRLRLATVLLATGLLAEADACAAEAAPLANDPVPFWQIGVEARMALGNLEGAAQLMNQMLGNEASGGEALGILALLKSGPAASMDLLKGLSTPRAAIWRAVAGASQGALEDVDANLGLLAPNETEISPRDYNIFVLVLDRSLSTLPEQLRLLVPRIRSADPGSLEAEARRVSQHCESLLALVMKLEPPEAHRRSHDGRRLAQSLLFQSARETLAFAIGGDEDDRLNAGVSLSEAVRNLEAARAMYVAERRVGGSGASNGLDHGNGGGGGGRRTGLLGERDPATSR
ncbi:MAG: hypothetical protein IT207_11550 [Fimbriimonadaceae bacterium]|nr:hypothetical protein [Fimbriimonadaceae bacterium]